MAALLRNLPFYDADATVRCLGQAFQLLPLQIIVWLSLSPKGLRELEARAPRFPAIVDTGFTDTILIHEQHLRRLAGYEPAHFPRQNATFRTHDRSIPVRRANAWLHPNVPGERDTFTNARPLLLELHRGIGITSGQDVYQRVPLIGARALRGAKLRLKIDYDGCRVDVLTPPRFWLFG